MKRSKLETILSLAGSLFALIAIFYKPLGLSEAWGWVGSILMLVCVIPFLILQRRRRGARLAGDPSAAQAQPPKSRLWLLLAVLVIVSLSSPFWLPCTGVSLSFSLLVISAIISCIFSVGVLILAWRYWWPKV
jgi:hypothetical protein